MTSNMSKFDKIKMNNWMRVQMKGPIRTKYDFKTRSTLREHGNWKKTTSVQNNYSGVYSSENGNMSHIEC